MPRIYDHGSGWAAALESASATGEGLRRFRLEDEDRADARAFRARQEGRLDRGEARQSELDAQAKADRDRAFSLQKSELDIRNRREDAQEQRYEREYQNALEKTKAEAEVRKRQLADLDLSMEERKADRQGAQIASHMALQRVLGPAGAAKWQAENAIFEQVRAKMSPQGQAYVDKKFAEQRRGDITQASVGRLTSKLHTLAADPWALSHETTDEQGNLVAMRDDEINDRVKQWMDTLGSVDPRDPSSLQVVGTIEGDVNELTRSLAQQRTFARRRTKTISKAQQLLDVDPDVLYGQLGGASLYARGHKEAEALLQLYLADPEAEPDKFAPQFQKLLFTPDSVKQELTELKQKSEDTYRGRALQVLGSVTQNQGESDQDYMKRYNARRLELLGPAPGEAIRPTFSQEMQSRRGSESVNQSRVRRGMAPLPDMKLDPSKPLAPQVAEQEAPPSNKAPEAGGGSKQQDLTNEPDAAPAENQKALIGALEARVKSGNIKTPEQFKAKLDELADTLGLGSLSPETKAAIAATFAKLTGGGARNELYKAVRSKP